jgi:hypothetical protein
VHRLPVMDKVSYINAFSPEQRCVGGRIPLYGSVLPAAWPARASWGLASE